MNAHDAAREAARTLLASVETPGEPVTVHLDGDEVRVTVRIVRVDRGNRTPCERDVLLVLASSRLPQPTSRILAELERLQLYHGEITVKRTLARLVKAGVILCNRSAPRGYRLPS